MRIDRDAVAELEARLEPRTREGVHRAVDSIVAAKRRGGGVAVVTGSGPNVHEGVTTLLAELMRVGIVDGVTTSSAVIAHEMGGVLDEVKRVDGTAIAAHVDEAWLPRGGAFELSLIGDDLLAEVERDVGLDRDLIEALRRAPGQTVIKAAGNLGYPMGLYAERLAAELLPVARERGLALEEALGAGADPRTMIGTGARKGLPVLVSIPQLVGGGGVGLAVGDSLSVAERARRVAALLGSADVIVESAVALTQEIHDGPFETHTGHGLWAAWQGEPTYSLEGRTLVRIDLDPTLEQVCRIEREGSAVQGAIDRGMPKTKTFDVPFRMEMSGFARLEGSIPIVGDIGAVWPVLALRAADQLGIELAFMSYPQQSPPGQAMREWIVRSIRPLTRTAALAALADRGRGAGTPTSPARPG